MVAGVNLLHLTLKKSWVLKPNTINPFQANMWCYVKADIFSLLPFIEDFAFINHIRN